MTTVPVFKPLIEHEEISAAVESLELGWLGMGSYVKQFEDAVSKVCHLELDDDRFVVAVSTGHAALHLSLLMMGIKSGDEIITPSFNNAADFQAIKACGADPVFVDISEETLCIDVDKIEELIGPKTKCIVVMDYDISLCDHARIAEIADRHGIKVLHDAAHSFGSFYRGQPVGRQHPYTAFSFDPVKAITCIDGGAIVVQGDDKVAELQAKRLIGMTQPAAQMYKNSRAWTYDIADLGFRYHLANLHAAIGVAQIAKIDEIRASRQRACERYFVELSSLEWITVPGGEFREVNPFLYYVRVPNGQREKLREHMAAKGVDTGIHWQAGHSFSFFEKCRRGSLAVTEKIVEEVLSIPLHSRMSPDDQTRVIDSIRTFRPSK